MKKTVIFLVFTLIFSGHAFAAVLDFEDLTGTGQYGLMPPVYNGFNLTDGGADATWNWINGPAHTAGHFYNIGTDGTYSLARTSFDERPIWRDDPFYFTGIQLTPNVSDGSTSTVKVAGLLDGTVQYQWTIVFTEITANQYFVYGDIADWIYTLVDEVRFTAWTPTTAQAFCLDNFTYEEPDCPPTVPIPGAVWLLASGLFGLAGLRKKLK